MYSTRPRKLAEMGLGWLSEEIDAVDVWPDNEQAVEVFEDMRTQWNVGFNGPLGLRYEALAFVCDARGVAATERGDLLTSIRVMESAALEAMRAQ